MITLLLLLWLRRMMAGTPLAGFRLHPALFTILLLLLAFTACGQQQFFTIQRNGGYVGSLRLEVAGQQGTAHIRLESLVNTRIVVPVRIKATEECRYQQNRLVFASVRRTVNGVEKENRTLTAVGSGYRLASEGQERSLELPAITYSTLCLYVWEPLNHSQVYSDAHGQMVPIQKLGAGHYRVALPDGKTNDFWYSGGRCSRVVLRSRWFTAEMIADTQ